jgi:hypothetical protein
MPRNFRLFVIIGLLALLLLLPVIATLVQTTNVGRSIISDARPTKVIQWVGGECSASDRVLLKFPVPMRPLLEKVRFEMWENTFTHEVQINGQWLPITDRDVESINARNVNEVYGMWLLTWDCGAMPYVSFDTWEWSIDGLPAGCMQVVGLPIESDPAYTLSENAQRVLNWLRSNNSTGTFDAGVCGNEIIMIEEADGIINFSDEATGQSQSQGWTQFTYGEDGIISFYAAGPRYSGSVLIP